MLLSTLLLLTQKAPVSFADGVISTAAFESKPHLSPDQKTLYFVKSTAQFTDFKIYVSRLTGSKWSTPVVAPFSGKYRDSDPFITPDGKRFYFTSDRPFPRKKRNDMDIWMMERKGAGWGEPTRLGGDINSREDEWYPTVSADGTLFFGSARSTSRGGCDLWKVKAGSKIPENLGPMINTAYDEIEPFITPDGKTLIFNSNRPGGRGDLDFYSSRLSGGKWSKPQALPPIINTTGAMMSPKISPDGRKFLFTKYRGPGRLGDIMIVDRAVALP